MEPIADWALLWRQVVTTRRSGRREPGDSRREDVWAGRADDFHARVHRRFETAVATRETILAHVDAATTLLDIGAGTGSWALPLTSHLARVTALEPSPSMREVLASNLTGSGTTNVEVVDGRWPEAELPAHDVILCSHAMYGAEDLVGYLRRMEVLARRRVILVVRAPSRDSLMADAARIAWGHPHFAPDFTIAYNVLLDMGIHPDVVIEQGGRWRLEGSLTREAALADVRNRLGLPEGPGPEDPALVELLARRLIERDGRLEWPGRYRSAVIHWAPGEH